MTSFLYKQKIRIFDYKQQFDQPLRDAIIHHAKQIAHDNGLTIEYLRKKNFRKEDRIADAFSPDMLHTILDDFARTYCPVIDRFQLTYHWSIMQVEYATDIVFSRQAYLQGMYDIFTRTAIHTVKPQTIATFLGKKLHGNYQDDSGNRFNTPH